MSDDQNSQLLSQSLATNMDASQMRDPFVRAQQQYQDSLGSGQIMSSTPMQSQPQSQFTPNMGQSSPSTPQGQEATAAATASTKPMLFNPSVSQDFSNFDSSPLPKALTALGVNPQGLAMNDIGKMQLMGRLKNKFGVGFQQSPQVMDVLGMFDKHLQGLTDNNSAKGMESAGQRTLAALLGGKA